MENGDIHFGEWKDNNIDGYGKQVFSGGNESYTGNFKKGKFHGIVEMCETCGQSPYTFVGNFVNGKANGIGEDKLGSGEIYTGEWKDGGKSGLVEKNKDRCRILGEMVAGEWDGLTIFENPHYQLTGYYEEGVREGWAEQKLSDGNYEFRRYEGGRIQEQKSQKPRDWVPLKRKHVRANEN